MRQAWADSALHRWTTKRATESGSSLRGSKPQRLLRAWRLDRWLQSAKQVRSFNAHLRKHSEAAGTTHRTVAAVCGRLLLIHRGSGARSTRAPLNDESKKQDTQKAWQARIAKNPLGQNPRAIR